MSDALTRERLDTAPAVGRGSVDVPRDTPRRGFSVLLASTGQRLGLVGAVLVLLWLCVYWALR